MVHTSMQLRRWADDEYDVTVIRRDIAIIDGRAKHTDTEPRIRTYVAISRASLERFYSISHGYQSAYNTKLKRERVR